MVLALNRATNQLLAQNGSLGGLHVCRKRVEVNQRE